MTRRFLYLLAAIAIVLFSLHWLGFLGNPAKVRSFAYWVHGEITNLNTSEGYFAVFLALVGVVGVILPFLKKDPGAKIREAAAEAAQDDAQALVKFERERVEPDRLMPKDQSIAEYLDQLEGMLREAFSRSQFVALSARAEEDDMRIRSVPMRFETPETPDGEAQSVDLLNVYKRFRNSVILGAPGAGKSTCLNRLARDLIDRYRSNPGEELIPVFCSLADWTNKRMSALALIKSSINRLTGPSNALIYNIEDLLANGRVVVLLDGLNEMPGRAGGDARRYAHRQGG